LDYIYVLKESRFVSCNFSVFISDMGVIRKALNSISVSRYTCYSSEWMAARDKRRPL